MNLGVEHQQLLTSQHKRHQPYVPPDEGTQQHLQPRRRGQPRLRPSHVQSAKSRFGETAVQVPQLPQETGCEERDGRRTYRLERYHHILSGQD